MAEIINRISTHSISTPIFCFFVLVTIVCCTPYLIGVNGYAFLCVITLPMVFTRLRTHAYRTNSAIVVSTFLYVIVIVIYRLFGISTASPGYYLGLLPFYLIVLLLPIVPHDGSSKTTRRLWWFIMAIMLFNLADNIRLSYLHPEINIMRFYLDPSFLASLNAGGGSFYTFSLFFFCVSFFVWLNTDVRRVKWFSLVAAVITAVYICWFCFKASVVLFFFLSAGLIYYAKKSKDRTSFFIIASLSGLAVVSIIGALSDEIIDFIIDVSPNKRLTMRFVTLIDENAYEAEDVTVTGRTNLYMLSIKTWLTNVWTFIFGIGDHFSLMNAAKTGIGQHADLLDLLARYGLLGASLVFVMLKSCFKYILSLFEKQYWLQIGTILLIYILCGVTKGIFKIEIGCALFILLPLSASILKHQQKVLKTKK